MGQSWASATQRIRNAEEGRLRRRAGRKRGGEAEEQMLFRPEYLRKKEGALKIAAGATLERKAQEKGNDEKEEERKRGGRGEGG